MSINRVTISGNLTHGAQVRYTKDGSPVASFGVAVNDRKLNPATGEWEDRPNFVDCTLFGKRGEKLAAYLTKGAKVAVEGKLRYSSWERDGQRRSKLEVSVEELELMGAKGGSKGQAQPSCPAEMDDVDAQYAAIPTTLPSLESSVYDEDIPF